MKHRFVSISLNVVMLMIATAYSLTSCSSLENTPVKKNENHFHLAFLDWNKVSRPKGNVYYTWDTLWPRLKDVYPSAMIYSINEVGVESYDWTRQVITLTPKESEMLLDVLACSQEERQYPYFCLGKHPFIVLVNDIPIYGCEFAEVGSAVARPYPVIHLSGENGKMVFSMIGKPASISDIIKDERIKTIFSDLGKLIE